MSWNVRDYIKALGILFVLFGLVFVASEGQSERKETLIEPAEVELVLYISDETTETEVSADNNT